MVVWRAPYYHTKTVQITRFENPMGFELAEDQDSNDQIHAQI
jgi:hypothetical protein